MLSPMLFHDSSLGFFDSPAGAIIASCFMLISAVNFALHFTVVRGRSPGAYLRDPEVRAFAGFVSVVILITLAMLFLWEAYSGAGETVVGACIGERAEGLEYPEIHVGTVLETEFRAWVLLPVEVEIASAERQKIRISCQRRARR